MIKECKGTFNGPTYDYEGSGSIHELHQEGPNRRRAEPNGLSTYYNGASEEQVPLSSRDVRNSEQSSGFIVNPNLQTSIPYDLNPRIAPKPIGIRENIGTNSNAAIQLTNSHIYASSDAKNSDLEQQSSSIDFELELKKSDDSILYVIDECPTCLEEYSEENPKMTTKCEHNFHLACIFEWLERSDTCPICNKEMEINYHD
ncbi:hypothetical protein V2J09_020227 [Rumex salicifolius]